MKKKKDITITISKILIFGGILIIILWIIGKLLGWIHSPIWIEVIPLFGGTVALLGIGITIGKVLQKIDMVIIDVEKLNNKTDDLNKRVFVIENKLAI